MAGQLIPPPELSPPIHEGLSSEERIAAWADWVDACHEFVLAGLRMEVGEAGDLEAAYRRWNQAQLAEHDRMIRHMIGELGRRGRKHGGANHSGSVA